MESNRNGGNTIHRENHSHERTTGNLTTYKTKFSNMDISDDVNRVPTRTGKPGKPGKLGRHFPVREKSGNFEQTGKVREKSGKITQNTGKLWEFEMNVI